MEDCKFCKGLMLRSEYVGKGLKTMAMNFNQIFGAINEEDKQDGIWLDDENLLGFESSSGEYAPQYISINYCPMCGRNLVKKEVINDQI